MCENRFSAKIALRFAAFRHSNIAGPIWLGLGLELTPILREGWVRSLPETGIDPGYECLRRFLDSSVLTKHTTQSLLRFPDMFQHI